MGKKGFIKRICLILALSCTFAACYLPLQASAATSSQIQGQINDLESKSKKLEKEIKELKKDKSKQVQLKGAIEKKVANVQQEINLCNQKISGYQAEINKSQAKIDQKNAEMQQDKISFKKRIRIIYMTGSGNGKINVIMGSSSFQNYLTLSALTGKVSARDKILMENITKTVKEIEKEKAAIQSVIDEQNAVKATLAAKKADLNSDVAEYDSVINSINKEQSKLEKENKEYENQIKQLDKQMRALNQKAAASGVVYNGEQFGWPVPGYYNVYSPYGTRSGRQHKGVDISQGGINGAKVVAAAGGVVISAGWNGAYGNCIMINHGTSNGKTYITLYGHLSSIKTSAGARVSKGQYIGNVGSTGRSTGPHLHFEIRVNGNPVNPMGYFSKAK